MPKSKDYERLIAAAHGMALQAALHKGRFTTAGFEADFSDRLTEGADDLRVALDQRNTSIGRRSSASAGMNQELLRGRDHLRMLDDREMPRLRGDSARLAEWATLSRFSILTRRKPVDPPAADPSPNHPTDETKGAAARAANTESSETPSIASPEMTTEELQKAA